MFTLKFVFKNIVSRKSSLVIVLFIAFSIGVFVLANAIFDGTRTGIEKTFSRNFTGDFVVRPKVSFPMSLFGDETPVTGTLSELPQLIPYQMIFDYVQRSGFARTVFPQITGQAVIRIDGSNFPGYFFGVDAPAYVDAMDGIRIVSGAPYSRDENALMLSSGVVKKISDEAGVALNVGDELQLASFTGTSFTLRSAALSAIYEYEVQNDLQDRIVLVSPELLRQLIGLGTTEIDQELFTDENSGLLSTLDSGSIDDLFFDDDVSDDGGSKFAGVGADSAESGSGWSEADGRSEGGGRIDVADAENEETIWNYIVCVANDGVVANRAIRNLNRYFEKMEWNVEAVDWRSAAGFSAQYIYWIRLVFNIGLLIIIATGYIIVNNALVINALDRTTETGALRAIGASRRFVAMEYLLETLMLTISAGVAGCVLGAAGAAVLSSAGISFSNPYLVQLFGGETLFTSVGASNIFGAMALSLALAVVSWLYPVRIALGTSPAAAMEGVR